MKVFKAVQVSNKRYFSITRIILPPRWIEEYFKNKFTTPKHKTSLYFAFKTYKDADTFCYNQGFALWQDTEIWEAEATIIPYEPKRLKTMHKKREPVGFWRHISGCIKKKAKNMIGIGCYAPTGTIWCKKIKLLKCLRRYNH